MVYPALTYLEEVGYVTVEVEATASATRSPTPAVNTSTRSANRSSCCSRSSPTSGARWNSCGVHSRAKRRERRQHARLAAGFVEARLALKRALLHKAGAGADEQRRIAAILLRAATEIESGSTA